MIKDDGMNSGNDAGSLSPHGGKGVQTTINTTPGFGGRVTTVQIIDDVDT